MARSRMREFTLGSLSESW